ncbi:hypothetical protein C8J57DRAFT_1467114 [Mycena rebaudengoi]|nr:hypothetical protein C8J57DRAFT_1467114 [Mycena rebaudengoi]
MNSYTLFSRQMRDQDYYASNGNCVVLVKNTLFKIDRDKFCRISPVFRHISDFDQGLSPRNRDGSSDVKPLVLLESTVEEFRVVCWMLESHLADPQIEGRQLPLDLTTHSLRTLAKTCHQYGCEIQKRLVIDEMLREFTALTHPNEVSVDELISTTRLAHQLEESELLNLVESIWIELINSRNADDVELHIDQIYTSLIRALEVGADLDLPKLQGNAYYAVMLLLIPTYRPSSRPNHSLFSLDKYISSHTGTIYRAHDELKEYWAALASAPLIPRTGCRWGDAHQRTCVPAWESKWKSLHSNLMVKFPLDVRGYLQCMKAFIAVDEEAKRYCWHASGGAVIEKLVADFQQIIPVFFLAQ